MNRLTILIILMICGLGMKAEINDSIYEADPYFLLMGEADEAIKEKNWKEAAARLTDALNVKPNHPSNSLLYNNLAIVYSAMNLDSLAVSAYTRGLEIAPGMVTLRTGRGLTLFRMGYVASAYDDFSRALEVDSLCTDALFYRGMINLGSGELNLAEHDFKALERVAPKSIDTAIGMSNMYVATKRYREAIPYIESLIENDPCAENYVLLSKCWLGLDELSKAAEAIGEGLRRYPAEPELYVERAELNKLRYRADDARADAEKAIRLGVPRARLEQFLK